MINERDYLNEKHLQTDAEEPEIDAREAYRRFMYNPDNEFRCSGCPENKDMASNGNPLPCGQQNCWVTCHCYGVNY